MSRDAVDLFVEQWRRERPELDASPLGVVSRILMLAKSLESGADRALEQFGLSLWQFDVLAALRRSGSPFKLSPTQLMEYVTLTSGAMTNRIDRLEEMKLVERESDPDDRRGVLIALTPEGKNLVDQAIGARLLEARNTIAHLPVADQKTLAGLLRRLMLRESILPVRRRRGRAVAGTNGY